jgi:hypothetical protein
VIDYGEQHQLPEDSEYLGKIYSAAQKMYVSFFRDLAADRSRLDQLPSPYNEEYGAFLDRVGDVEDKASLEKALSIDNLLEPARVRKRGTLIWRNQAGPMTLWKLPEGTILKDPTDRRERWRALCSPKLVASFSNVVALGLPKNVSGPYIGQVTEDLAALGLVASAAPNSVWFKSAGVDKGVPIDWLSKRRGGFGFDLKNAVAFGDMPMGNDAPLWSFQEQGMPFVSVGDEPAASPNSNTGHPYFVVSGFETGTALVLEELADCLEREIEEAKKQGRQPHSLSEIGIDMCKIVGVAQGKLQQVSSRL